MGKFKLMVIGDAPSSSTGLGRITRELCVRIHKDLGETFELATYGLGGINSRRFPWRQYQIANLHNWAPNDLPRVWKDFAGDERGIIFPIWNPSSLGWLADPTKLPAGTLRDFLLSDPFDRWGYFPVDAEGPNGLMPREIKDVCSRFDRTLFYTKWAADMFSRTTGIPTYEKAFGDVREVARKESAGRTVAEYAFRTLTEEEAALYEALGRSIRHLPHGTDTKIFYPRDRQEMRKTFIETATGKEAPGPQPVHESIFLVGIIATCTARKDWDLGFQVCQELRKRGLNVVLWAHTDSLVKHWNLPALAEAYGMKDRVVFTTTDLSDEQMAEAQCACDCILGVGRGEGWGLVESSSLACGIPVITGGYAGAAEFVPAAYQVQPVGFHGEGPTGNRRPVFRAEDWADVAQAAIGTKPSLPEGLSWDECWPAWKKWLLEGANGESSSAIDA